MPKVKEKLNKMGETIKMTAKATAEQFNSLPRGLKIALCFMYGFAVGRSLQRHLDN